MKRPIFNEQTEQDLHGLVEHLPHALGLYGDKGVGLLTAARHLVDMAGGQMIPVYPERSGVIDREAGYISIAAVQRLYTLTQGKSKTRRCFVMIGADTMTSQAQNAFLKLLEEPTRNTTFILLTHQPELLLATVRSRLQMQRIIPLSQEQSMVLLDRLNVHDATQRQQLLFLASGLPAQLTRLAQSDTEFEAEASLLRQARSFVQGTTYDKLVIAHAVKNSRADARRIIVHAVNLIKRDVTAKTAVDDTIILLLLRLEQALKRIDGNGNIRLALASVATG